MPSIKAALQNDLNKNDVFVGANWRVRPKIREFISRIRYEQLLFALLAPYSSLSLRLLLGFAVVGFGVGTLSRATTQAPPNPFEAYLDIFPGQPMSAVAARGFSCQSVQNYYTTPAEGRCVWTPSTGLFSSIEVVGSSQRVREIKFTLNQNTLRLGDLLVTFELPEFRSYPQTTFAFWRDYFVTLPTGKESDIPPAYELVWSVSFTWADR